MFQQHDTICAVSTPSGVGGIAVVRISGQQAVEIAGKIWKGRDLAVARSHTASLGLIVDPKSGETVDQGVATLFRAPNSFTGEDVVELSVHGSRWVQREVVNLLVRCGCRIAEPGEFTRRAFASGKMDLAEAEAVADVIASDSRASHRIAMAQMRGSFSGELKMMREKLLELAALLELELDFSEEDVEFADRTQLTALASQILAKVERLANSFSTGNAIKNGIPVAIVGAPNAGKSTLLNQLLGDEKAIVSNIPGTTRDIIEDSLEIEGLQFRIIDTAGLRNTSDTIEQLGIKRAVSQIEKARIVVWVADPRMAPDDAKHTLAEIKNAIPAEATLIIAKNMADIAPDTPLPFAVPSEYTSITISAATGQGVDTLRKALVSASGIDSWNEQVIVTNARHYQALANARESLERTIGGLSANIPADLVAQDLRESLHHLGAITGAITTPEILSSIFTRFCIGK